MRLATLAAGAVLLLPATLPGQDAAGRDELAALGHRLETAAARVSVATPGFLGSPATRAYRVPGVGAVVVLAPRVLASPAQARVFLPLSAPPAPRSVAASRAELERAILELRSSLERASAPRPATRSVTDTDLRALERDAEQRLAAAARARAEAFRALADAMSAMPDMPRLTLGPASAPSSWSAPPVARLQDARPSPRPEDTLVRVRAALRAALPEAVETLVALPGSESVSVAVDFLAPGSWPGSAPQRTLVVRARVADLRAVAAGQGTADTVAVEVLEY